MVAFTVPPGAVKGRAIAVIIMSSFGAVWMAGAANFLRRLNWATVLMIAALTGSLFWGAARELHASRIAEMASAPTSRTQWTPAVRRNFQWVLALEWVPIVAAAIVFARLRRPHLILPAIAIIVGLHFFQLAKMFGAPLYYFTGSALGIGPIASLRRPILDRLVLWCSEPFLLLRP